MVGRRPVDAIIRRNGALWGIDHTSIDFLADERSYRPKFQKVVVPIESEISAAFPDDSIHISVQFGSIQKGDWSQLSRTLADGCKDYLANSGHEKPGRAGPTVNIAGLPVRISKWRATRKGAGRCFVGQLISGEQAAYSELKDNVRAALQHKADQLKPYGETHGSTALLLDSDYLDVPEVAKALEDDLGFRTEVAACAITEIYACYVNTETDAEWICPLKRGNRAHLDIPDFWRWWHRQYELIYGDQE
jgi:hypothetical protein